MDSLDRMDRMDNPKVTRKLVTKLGLLAQTKRQMSMITQTKDAKF